MVEHTWRNLLQQLHSGEEKLPFELNQKQIKYLRAVAFHGILATVNVIPGTGPAAVALRA